MVEHYFVAAYQSAQPGQGYIRIFTDLKDGPAFLTVPMIAPTAS
jgi:hypothetical protein